MIWRKFFLLSKKMEQCAEMKDIICYEIAKHCDQLTCKMLMSTCKELREFERNNTIYLYPCINDNNIEDMVKNDCFISFSVAKLYPFQHNSIHYMAFEYNNSRFDCCICNLLYLTRQYQAFRIFKLLYSNWGIYLINNELLTFHNYIYRLLECNHYSTVDDCNTLNLPFLKYLVKEAISTKYNGDSNELSSFIIKIYDEPLVLEIVSKLPCKCPPYIFIKSIKKDSPRCFEYLLNKKLHINHYKLLNLIIELGDINCFLIAHKNLKIKVNYYTLLKNAIKARKIHITIFLLTKIHKLNINKLINHIKKHHFEEEIINAIYLGNAFSPLLLVPLKKNDYIDADKELLIKNMFFGKMYTVLK